MEHFFTKAFLYCSLYFGSCRQQDLIPSRSSVQPVLLNQEKPKLHCQGERKTTQKLPDERKPGTSIATSSKIPGPSGFLQYPFIGFAVVILRLNKICRALQVGAGPKFHQKSR